MSQCHEHVNAKLEDLCDYHLVFKKPMDLGTIKGKLKSKVYSSPKDFVDDIRLTFAKAKKLNLETHKLEAMFEAWWQDTITKDG